MTTIAALPCGLIWLATLLLPHLAASETGPGDDKVTVEGRVTAVMEIDPPRLNVEVKSKRYTIRLTDETKVSKKGKAVKFGDLKENQKVEVIGVCPDSDSPLQLKAEKIKILEDPAK